jgi:hypothetical protein
MHLRFQSFDELGDEELIIVVRVIHGYLQIHQRMKFLLIFLHGPLLFEIEQSLQTLSLIVSPKLSLDSMNELWPEPQTQSQHDTEIW